METHIGGIHHITAVTSSAKDNLEFYTKVLGLRLVKKTVNFDDPTTYHLYYGDAGGAPGTILTFFPWEGLPQGKPGAGMVTATAFAIPRASAAFWEKRLHDHGIESSSTERFGEAVTRFHDPHGLPLELIATDADLPEDTWADATVPPEHRIAGFHSATATLRALDQTQNLLVDVMGMTFHGREGNRYRFHMEAGGSAGAFYDVLVDAQAPPARSGAGTVHHIAFRAPGSDDQKNWQTHLYDRGFTPTPVRDRKYFKSIYFNEPSGVLFEIATDAPGFAVDEHPDRLGQELMLPDGLEPMRGNIASALPDLSPTDTVYEFVMPDEPDDDGTTIVALHGTGGDEHDLIPLSRQISETAAVLSPRGKVSENGMNRFFRRLANNVFDEIDVIRRSHELANFIRESADRYRRDPEQVVGLGYSNGANIAAALLFLRPEAFSRAILYRPMMPLEELPPVDLKGKEILVLRGRHDRVIPSASTDRLIEALTAAGAAVDVRDMEAGHELTRKDVEAAHLWLACLSGKPGVDCRVAV